MKFIIWGAGTRGKRLLEFLGKDKVEAIIDSNSAIQGSLCFGKKIINYNEYKRAYKKYSIIISPIYGQASIEKILKRDGIFNYFNLLSCPNSFYEYDYEKILEDVLKIIKENKVEALYGMNFFNLLIWDFCKTHLRYIIPIIAELEMEKNKMKIFKDINDGLNIINFNENSIQFNNILCIDKKQKEKIDLLDIKNKKNIIIFSLPEIKKHFYNSEIQKFKNKHDNQRCFIVANGPSLTFQDLETLDRNNEICIGMNLIFNSFNYVKWRPNYYVAADPGIIKVYGKDICDIDIEHKFISDNYPEFWDRKRNFNIYKVHVFHDVFIPNLPKFSVDFAQGAYSTYNVTYICLQLAVYLGFKQIILIGVDFNNLTTDKNSHFIENYYGLKKREIDKACLKGQYTEEEMLNLHMMGYIKVFEYTSSEKIEIYNATRGGNLEIFKRVNFDELF